MKLMGATVCNQLIPTQVKNKEEWIRMIVLK